MNAKYQEECAQQNVPLEDCVLLDKVVSDFAGANYYWVLLAILLFVISNVSRTQRWLMLLRPLGYSPRFINGFGAIVIGYFANLALPRIGEVVRAGTLTQYEKIGV